MRWRGWPGCTRPSDVWRKRLPKSSPIPRPRTVWSSLCEFANAGHPVFTIINTEHWYAIGNFRETDLAGIKPGQHATVFVMTQPRLPLGGTVDSLGWGVASGVSATFGGLPHVESTLNWVRIAARFPVRVLLDDPPADLMRLGALAVIEIKK
jgi:membrane fusion protein, multidrug efflux system